MENIEQSNNNWNSDVRYNNWPIVRSGYKKLSKKYFLAGEYEKSIYYDCISLSSGFIAKELDNNKVSQTTVSDAFGEDKLMNFLTDNISNLTIRSQTIESVFNENDGYKRLVADCSKLPHEWNVIQISQMSDEYTGYGTKKDCYTQEFPLRITMFRYNQSNRLNDHPISFALKSPPFLSTAYLVYQDMFKSFSQNYQTNEYVLKLDTELEKLKNEMSQWLGPWITMFSGKVKGDEGELLVQELFDEVKDFCKQDAEISDQQYVLICTVARRLDLLDTNLIAQAAEHIGVNQSQRARLNKFFGEMKKKYNFQSYKHYPCILVVEDTLDSMPWETVHQSQEFCRFSSIYLLFDLYEKYRNKIKNGYVQLALKNGNILVNPDDDEKLARMKNRMTKIYSKWLPESKCISGEKPKEEDMHDLLCNGDFFIYSGHGSSLQFLKDSEIRTESVLMLFGCDSSALQARGLVGEAFGSPQIYHSMKSPGVLGALSIITDVLTDLISIWIVSQWVHSRKSTTDVDIYEDIYDASFKKKRLHSILMKIHDKKEPSLLAILADIRSEAFITLRMSSAFIFRGLPLYNKLMKK